MPQSLLLGWKNWTPQTPSVAISQTSTSWKVQDQFLSLRVIWPSYLGASRLQDTWHHPTWELEPSQGLEASFTRLSVESRRQDTKPSTGIMNSGRFARKFMCQGHHTLPSPRTDIKNGSCGPLNSFIFPEKNILIIISEDFHLFLPWFLLQHTPFMLGDVEQVWGFEDLPKGRLNWGDT